ncbi:hypothetical protein DXF86_25890, partial [Citrobacter freundii]
VGIVNTKSINGNHLTVFTVRVKISVTAINLLEIARQGIEYRLVIRRTDSITMIMLLIYMAFILYVVGI